MRILYAIQGTGNGHISRAREIVPLLQQHGEVDLLLSGTQADVNLSQPLAYRFHGFSFVFGKKGGVDHWKTYKMMDLPRLKKDIRSIPLRNYNLIINDFEPVTAWACKLQKVPSVSLSHQASFLSPKTPRPSNYFHWAEWVFKHYAPSTHRIGFHFDRYDDFIHTPVIRSDIRKQEPKNCGHITVYLPAFDDRLLLSYLKGMPDIRFEVFSKHALKSYSDGNVSVQPVNNENYNVSLAGCLGLLTGGGFEGPAEALYLGKKVLVIPMKNQYEQLCNAEAAKRLGIPVIYQIDQDFVKRLRRWIEDPFFVKMTFPDETARIVADMVNKFAV